MFGVRFPEIERRRVLNLSQGEVGEFDDACSTLTPSGIFWVDFYGRLLRGQEGFAIQALWLPDGFLQSLCGKLSLDLTGNAFNALCILKHLCAVVALQGFVVKRSMDLTPVPRAISQKRQSDDTSDRRKTHQCQSAVGSSFSTGISLDWGLFSDVPQHVAHSEPALALSPSLLAAHEQGVRSSINYFATWLPRPTRRSLLVTFLIGDFHC